MKKQFKVLLLIAMICVLAFATMLVSSALDAEQGENAWEVVGKGYAATIQAAIDDAATTDGDTIKLLKSEWTEQGFTITKSVTIDGQGNRLTVSTQYSTSGALVLINAANVKVTNINLMGDGTQNYGFFRGIYENAVIELNDIILRGAAHAYWHTAEGTGTDLRFTGAKTDIYLTSYEAIMHGLGATKITVDLTTEGVPGYGIMKSGGKRVIRSSAGTAPEINILGGMVQIERGSHWPVIETSSGTVNIGGSAIIDTANTACLAVQATGSASVNVYGDATINCAANSTDYGAIWVSSGTGNVTISGNATINTPVCSSAVRINSTGNVTVSGNATINAKVGSSYPAIYVKGNGNIEISESATVNVTNSTVALIDGTGDVTVSGGTIVTTGGSGSGAFYAKNGTIAISGSTTIEVSGKPVFEVYGNVTVGEGVTLKSVNGAPLAYFGAAGSVAIASGVTIELINAPDAYLTTMVGNKEGIEGTFSMAAGAKFVLDGTNWIFSGDDAPWGTAWTAYDFEIRSLASLELNGEAFEMGTYFLSLEDYAYDPTGSYDAAGLLELMEMYILYYAYDQSGVTTAALAGDVSADRGGLVLNLTGLCPITIAGAEITVTGLSGEYAATAFTVLAGSLTVENCNINVESAPFAVVDGGALTYKNTIIVITGEMALALPGEGIVLDGVTLVVPTDSEIYPTAAHAAIGAYAPIVKFGGVEYKAWSCNKASGENASVVGAVSLYVNTGDAATSGIRFTSTVSADVLSALREGGKTLKFGTLVAPADYVAKAKSFTPAALVAAFGEGVTSYVKIPAVYSVLENDAGVTFSGILVNLKSNTRVYAAVSYIEVYEGETLVETIYSAYDAQFNAQSAEQLADAITETLDADQQAIVDAYANGKVN